MADVARKTFRLDDSALTVLVDKQSRGGGSENDTINRLLTNIPKAEKELQHQVLKRQEAEGEIIEWRKKYEQLQRQHAELVNALRVVGAALLPPTETTP